MALPQAEIQPLDAELNLLYDWDHSLYAPETKRAIAGTLLVHLLVVVIAVLSPPIHGHVQPVSDVRIDVRKSTPLIAPRLRPFELTQKAPNRGEIQKEVTLESLLPKREQTARNTPPARKFTPPSPTTQPIQPLIAEAPKLPPAQGNPQIDLPPLSVPQLPANEKPKIAFEAPGATAGSPTGSGKIASPKTSVDEAVRASVRNRTGSGVVVSDVVDLPTGSGATLSATPNQGRAGSSLELLSDPQGVDFKPYLVRVLAAVRRNWFAVLPESARLGQRGRTVIQFAINRDGRVPKLVISSPSGADALDRAAVAGISASNPLPPLPSEFKGEQIRLQLSFLYNIPVN